MNFDEATDLIRKGGMIDKVEIMQMDESYQSTYPPGWWVMLLGNIGGMPIRKAELLPLLLQLDPGKAVEDWLNENF